MADLFLPARQREVILAFAVPVPIKAVEVEPIELPGAGIVSMSLYDMARAFGVPWAEVEGRLRERCLTSRNDPGGMHDGSALIHAVPTMENTTS